MWLFFAGFALLVGASLRRTIPTEAALAKEIGGWTIRQTVALVGIVLVLLGLATAFAPDLPSPFPAGLALAAVAVLAPILATAFRRGWRHAAALTALRVLDAKRAGERPVLGVADFEASVLVFGWAVELMWAGAIAAYCSVLFEMRYPEIVGMGILGVPLVGALAFFVVQHWRIRRPLRELKRIASLPAGDVIPALDAALAATPSLDVLARPSLRYADASNPRIEQTR